MDGIIRFWKIDTNAESKLEEILSLKFYDHPFKSIKCGSFNYFATSSELNEIHIWHMESTKEIFLEHTVILEPPNLAAAAVPGSNSAPSSPFISRISSTLPSSSNKSSSVTNSKSQACFDWLPLFDGNNLFAYAKGKEIFLLNRQWKEDFHSYGTEWVSTKILTVAYNVESLVWTCDGTLVVSASNQLFVFTKWLNEKARVSQNQPTLFHLASSLYRPLHFYHPKMLAQYLISGHFNKNSHHP